MRSCRFALLLLIVAIVASPAAQAGLADPTPTLAGQPSFHLWSVPGVVNNGLATVFLCSNATSNAIRIGVEVFAPAGGASLNNASATSVLLQAGATTGFQTQSVAGLSYLNNLGLVVIQNGSARILASEHRNHLQRPPDGHGRSTQCDDELEDRQSQRPGDGEQLLSIGSLGSRWTPAGHWICSDASQIGRLSRQLDSNPVRELKKFRAKALTGFCELNSPRRSST